MFRTVADAQIEHDIAERISDAWGCEVGAFPPTCPVDLWLSDGTSLIGMAEMKRRHHSAAKYATVWMAVQKYFALAAAANAFGVPGWYVVQFDDDDIRAISVARVDARKVRIAERRDRGGAGFSDREPVISILVDDMDRLEEGGS